MTAFANDDQNIRSLPLIDSGQQVIEIIRGVHMCDFDNDELKTHEEAELVGNFFDLKKGYIDILDDMRSADVARLGIDLNFEIETLRKLVFFYLVQKDK